MLTRDLMWLIFILIVVLTVWGAQFRSTGEPVLSPPRGTNTIIEPATTQNSETPKTEIKISAPGIVTAIADREYIIIQNSGDTPIAMSGLSLRNKRNETVTIGFDTQGSRMILAPNEKAVIVTGKSPRSGNFKVNSCTGYFAQFQTFMPTLSTSCPRLSSLDAAKNLVESCRDYVSSIRSCQFPASIPTNITSVCNDFIQQHAGYQGCVKDHQSDKDFDKKEWRIYLNRGTEFWRNGDETIEVRSAEGKLLGSRTL